MRSRLLGRSSFVGAGAALSGAVRAGAVRAGVVGAAAAVAVVALAVPASAHVTVNPNTATQGGYTKVTFRVPNEEDAATTTTVEVDLPQDNPIASVSLKPVQGWTAVTTKTKLATPISNDDGQITEAITRITWTADAASAIRPGQFQEFDVSLGPLPKVAQLEFKALQTYSDGTVVRWIDDPVAGGDEPAHPAPILRLTTIVATSSAPATATSTTQSNNGTALAFGIAGTALGLVALVVALLGRRKSTLEPA